MTLPAVGAVGMTERMMYEDKLVCAAQALSTVERRKLLVFLHSYAQGKTLLNLLRGTSSRVRCTGWVDPAAAIARARPVPA